MSRAAARDRSANLSDAAIRAAIGGSKPTSRRPVLERAARRHPCVGAGGKLSLLTGVAGSGKTTLLKPLVDAWRDDGRTVIGMSTAWRQADALQEAGADETIALQPLLNAIDTGEFSADENTVLIVDEISQSVPHAEAPRASGQNRHDHQDARRPGTGASIEAGDTIALLKRVLPKSAMPEVLTAVRQKNDRDRKIAALFRDGKAATALAMKREDGTAEFLKGDTDQVVRQIADLYIERNDALKSQDPSYGITITTLTNARRPTSAGRSASVSEPAVRSERTRRPTRRWSIGPRSENSSTCLSRPAIAAHVPENRRRDRRQARHDRQ